MKFSDKDIARFESYYIKDCNSACWLWIGGTSCGYGAFWMDGALRRATHVAILIYKNEKLPNGMYVCHRCDVPGCVRPDHLFIGTPKDNQQDRLAKGRCSTQPKGKEHYNGKRTHCIRGHEFSEKNTHLRLNGKRQCRVCDRDYKYSVNRALGKVQKQRRC